MRKYFTEKSAIAVIKNIAKSASKNSSIKDPVYISGSGLLAACDGFRIAELFNPINGIEPAEKAPFNDNAILKSYGINLFEKSADSVKLDLSGSFEQIETPNINDVKVFAKVFCNAKNMKPYKVVNGDKVVYLNPHFITDAIKLFPAGEWFINRENSKKNPVFVIDENGFMLILPVNPPAETETDNIESVEYATIDENRYQYIRSIFINAGCKCESVRGEYWQHGGHFIAYGTAEMLFTGKKAIEELEKETKTAAADSVQDTTPEEVTPAADSEKVERKEMETMEEKRIEAAPETTPEKEPEKIDVSTLTAENLKDYLPALLMSLANDKHNSSIILSAGIQAGVIPPAALLEYFQFGRMPAVHTFDVWKKAGYTVKKGEKAAFTARIWKFTEKDITLTADDAVAMNAGNMLEGVTYKEGDTISRGDFIKKVAFFFTAGQVEKTPEPAPLMITEDLHKTARIEAYNDRKQARIDGIKAAAANRTTEAKRRLNAGWSKLDAIPFGQPVHGIRDRNYREKAGRQIDSGYRISKEADALEAKAQAAENNRSISSDDPLAVEKLTKKLDTLQKAQETMKAVNAYYRKHKTLTGCAGCLAVSETVIKAAESNINGIHGVPFPAWCLSNNSAEIRRIKSRVEDLQRKAEQEPGEWSGTGWTAETDLDDNRIRIYFEGKPNDETRGILKSNGFKWSPKAGAWQRQITRAAMWSMNRIAEKLS